MTKKHYIHNKSLIKNKFYYIINYRSNFQIGNYYISTNCKNFLEISYYVSEKLKELYNTLDEFVIMNVQKITL